MPARTFFRTLVTLHFALCLGLLLFIALAYWQVQGFKVSADGNDLFVYVVPTIAMIGYFGGKFLYQKWLQELATEDSLEHKLQRYQAASLIQYALLEGPAILALVGYLQTGTALYPVIALVLLAYLYARRPTRKRMVQDLPLNFEEKKLFDTLRPSEKNKK